MTLPCRAFVVIDSWAGRGRYRVTLLRETPKRFRARLEEHAKLPRHGFQAPGFEWLVPKGAVIIGHPDC